MRLEKIVFPKFLAEFYSCVATEGRLCPQPGVLHRIELVSRVAGQNSEKYIFEAKFFRMAFIQRWPGGPGDSRCICWLCLPHCLLLLSKASDQNLAQLAHILSFRQVRVQLE